MQCSHLLADCVLNSCWYISDIRLVICDLPVLHVKYNQSAFTWLYGMPVIQYMHSAIVVVLFPHSKGKCRVNTNVCFHQMGMWMCVGSAMHLAFSALNVFPLSNNSRFYMTGMAMWMQSAYKIRVWCVVHLTHWWWLLGIIPHVFYVYVSKHGWGSHG